MRNAKNIHQIASKGEETSWPTEMVDFEDTINREEPETISESKPIFPNEILNMIYHELALDTIPGQVILQRTSGRLVDYTSSKFSLCPIFKKDVFIKSGKSRDNYRITYSRHSGIVLWISPMSREIGRKYYDLVTFGGLGIYYIRPKIDEFVISFVIQEWSKDDIFLDAKLAHDFHMFRNVVLQGHPKYRHLLMRRRLSFQDVIRNVEVFDFVERLTIDSSFVRGTPGRSKDGGIARRKHFEKFASTVELSHRWYSWWAVADGFCIDVFRYNHMPSGWHCGLSVKINDAK